MGGKPRKREKMKSVYLTTAALGFITVLNAGVFDGIFSGDIQKPDVKSIMGNVKDAAGSNVLQSAAGMVPDEIMGLCYDYTPKVSTANSSGICSAIKGGIDPCFAAPDLSLYGYKKKNKTPAFKKELESIRQYCETLAGSATKKASLPEAIKTYKPSENVRTEDLPKNSELYGEGGLLGWDNIKAYKAGGTSVSNNFFLHKAVSTNDYLSFEYYKDVLENSVGQGASVKNKVNIFSRPELQAVTLSYTSIKDYEDDVEKMAGVLSTSTGQSSSVRISSVAESEMASATSEAAKEGIASKKSDEISNAVDKDVAYKTKFYRDITVNPNNRIVFPTKGYINTLPPEKKAAMVKKIEIQAKKDAALSASLREIGEMRKELARLVVENSKIASRKFDSAAAQAEINALIK